METLIPASKIANLSQGTFVGSVADNFGEEIEQKTFHAKIIVDVKAIKAEEKLYQKIPVITDFTDRDGNDHMEDMIKENYKRIVAETKRLVEDELARIAADPDLCHLLESAE